MSELESTADYLAAYALIQKSIVAPVSVSNPVTFHKGHFESTDPELHNCLVQTLQIIF